jgi:hypothetical protein
MMVGIISVQGNHEMPYTRVSSSGAEIAGDFGPWRAKNWEICGFRVHLL